MHITITPKSAADMPIWYGFTTQQTSAMNELLGQREMLQELIFSVFLGGIVRCGIFAFE